MSCGHFVSVALVTAIACVACGGSASETPPPLEPDLSKVPKGAPATGRYVVITPRSDAGRPERSDDERDEPAEDEAVPTWGD